jgi:hypothetical protein
MAEKNPNQSPEKTGLNASDFYTVDYGLEGDITLTDITPLPPLDDEGKGKGQKGGKRSKTGKKDKSKSKEDGIDADIYGENDGEGFTPSADISVSSGEEGKKKKSFLPFKSKAAKRPVPKIKWQKDLSFAGILLNKIKASHPAIIVGVDMHAKTINIMDIKGTNGKTAHVTRVPFKGNPEDDKFFDLLSGALMEFAKSRPPEKSLNFYIILPDNCAALDIITIPTISKKRVQESLEINISETYKDINALRMSCSTVVSSNRMVTYTLTSIRKKLLQNYKQALERVKMSPKVFTFSAAATLNSVFALQSRNRGRSFVFMDVKKHTTRFIIAAKGKLVGFYNHPIGYDILKPDRVVNEYTLYNHDIAELAVLNAEEKAKRKELTLLDAEAEEDSESFLDQVLGGGTEIPADAPTQNEAKKTPKVLLKKTPKRLPKFMLRPEPETPEGMIAENFRILLKWALLLVRSNKGLGKGCDPEYILVNIPPQFAFVIDEVNKEKKENGIEFRKFTTDHISPKVSANLELYGAVYTDTYNLQHNF